MTKIPYDYSTTAESTIARCDDVVLRNFESLGDNCEFGLVQRAVGVNQLGFFRFNFSSINALDKVLERKFVDFLSGAELSIETAPNNELIVCIPKYGFRYHTFKKAGSCNEEALRIQQVKVLGFLARKFIDDLQSGSKLFVRKDDPGLPITRVRGVLRKLNEFGNNSLLFVTSTDEVEKYGTVECVEPFLYRGYVDQLSTFEDAHGFSFHWFDVCRKAHALWQGRDISSEHLAPRQQITERYLVTSLDVLIARGLCESLPPMVINDDPIPLTVEHKEVEAAEQYFDTHLIGGNSRNHNNSKSFTGGAVRIQDAVIHGRSGIVTTGAYALAETVCVQRIAIIPGAYMDEQGNLSIPDDGPAALVDTAYHLLDREEGAFSGWLNQLLARYSPAEYDWLLRYPKTTSPPVLLIPDQPDISMLEAIQLLAPPTTPYLALADGSIVRARSLLYSCRAGVFTPLSNSNGARMRSNAIKTSINQPLPKHIYIPGSKEHGSRPANEADVVQRLEQLGFFVAAFVSVTFTEQTRLLSSVRVIICHSNVVELINPQLIRPDCSVYVIEPASKLKVAFAQHLDATQVAHRSVDLCCKVSTVDTLQNSNWNIDLDALEDLLHDT